MQHCHSASCFKEVKHGVTMGKRSFCSETCRRYWYEHEGGQFEVCVCGAELKEVNPEHADHVHNGRVICGRCAAGRIA